MEFVDCIVWVWYALDITFIRFVLKKEALLKQNYIPKILVIVFVFFGCESNKADLIIENGNIYTMNDLNPLVEAVAVKNGKIIGIGSKAPPSLIRTLWK